MVTSWGTKFNFPNDTSSAQGVQNYTTEGFACTIGLFGLITDGVVQHFGYTYDANVKRQPPLTDEDFAGIIGGALGAVVFCCVLGCVYKFCCAKSKDKDDDSSSDDEKRTRPAP